MHFTDSDTRERNRFVESSIEAALDSLSHPALVRDLGSRAMHFAQILEQAAVLSSKSERVTLPDSYKGDSERLFFFAVRPGENTMMAPEFNSQTERQRDRTLDQLRAWSAQPSAGFLYGLLLNRTKPEGYLPLSMHPSTIAMTGMTTHFIDLRPEAYRSTLPGAPANAFVRFSMRPLVVLKIGSGEKLTPPELVAHELVHVDQFTNRPVRTIDSQRSVDMQSLRDELEAYHVGAGVLLCNGPNMAEPAQGRTADASWKQQLFVELVRAAYNRGDVDPFRPSPALLKKLNELGLGGILHQTFDFSLIKGDSDGG